MNCQNRALIFFILAGMLFLTIGYIVSMAIGLYSLADTVKEFKHVETHKAKVITVQDKRSPTAEFIEISEPPNQDLQILAQIINAEAGNQPFEGKIAVGNVIMNRIDSPKFPDTIKDVIYQKGQFDPVRDGSINELPNDESIQAAQEVLNGSRVVDENVLFFYNPDISTSNWIFTRPVVTKIGEHAFTL